MTPEQAKHNAAVLLAYAEGNKIEFRRPPQPNWFQAQGEELSFEFDQLEYRVAPEPQEFDVWVKGDRIVTRGHLEIQSDGWKPARVRVIEPRQLRQPPEGIPQPPEGFECFGYGPLPSPPSKDHQDVAHYGSFTGWGIPGKGNTPCCYALRIGSEIHKKNFNL